MLWVRNSERARLDDSSLASLAAAGPAGSTQIWFLHSHLGPWCCLASVSLQHRIFWVFSVRREPLMDHVLRAPGPQCLRCLFRPPGAHPRHLAGKSSRGPVYIHGEGRENPFPHGRRVKVFTAFFSSPCLAFFFFFFLAVLASGVFWESSEVYRKHTLPTFYMHFWYNHLPWRCENLK